MKAMEHAIKEKGGPVEFELFYLDGCHQISFC
jgi:hypothetical protein